MDFRSFDSIATNYSAIRILAADYMAVSFDHTLEAVRSPEMSILLRIGLKEIADLEVDSNCSCCLVEEDSSGFLNSIVVSYMGVVEVSRILALNLVAFHMEFADLDITMILVLIHIDSNSIDLITDGIARIHYS
jgi:hypothetical protein